MSRSRKLALATTLSGAALLGFLATPVLAEKLGLGRTALPEEIAAWDVAVLPDGTGLPEGSGDVETGDEVFAAQCASCHGDFAEGLDSWPPLAGGDGTLTDRRPVKTIGSYWPYLSTVFDYVHRSMPFGAAQTSTVDETYAITAYLLYSNNLVGDDFVLTHENFAEIVLPNADGFIVDDRPDTEYPLFRAEPCMVNCRTTPPEVTKRAVDLGVTPEDPDGKPAGTLPPLTLAAATTEAPAETPAAATEGPDPALVEAGKAVYRKCQACHVVGEDAKNRTGPHLNALFGRTAGTIEGFRYSKPMIEAGAGGLVWTPETLSEYLSKPRDFIKGTRMTFAGLRSQEDLAAINAYLSTY